MGVEESVVDVADLMARVSVIFGGGLFVLLGFHLWLAYSLYTLAKKAEQDNVAWLSYIPMVNGLVMMKIADDELTGKWKGSLSWIFIICLVGGVFFLPLLVGLPVVLMYSWYVIETNRGGNPVLSIVLLMVTGMALLPVLAFRLRKRDIRVMEEGEVFE